MKVERLLHAFSLIGEDPARIQQLRQVAVALAVAGKLDTGNATLSPRDMMHAVEEVKADLVRRRVIPKPNKLQPVDQVELPEGFPDASRFAPLGSVARVEKGLTGIKQAQPGPFPLVVTGAERASCDHFDFEGAAAIIPLVSSTGHGHASLNRLHYEEGKFALGTILAAVFPFDPKLVSARFIFEYLSAFKEELLVTRMTGTANVTLSIGRISEVPVPLVDPTIQAQVDELMALLDRLEAARTAREATRDRLTAASLARLTAPDADVADFPANARFALATLPVLTTRPDQIKPLRQTILNLAVRGKLVAQDPADEPASELLKRIAAKRAELVKAGSAKREKPTSGEEFPFELPTSWSWCTLGKLCQLITKGSSPKWQGVSYVQQEGGLLFITSENVGNFTLRKLDDLKYVERRFKEVEPRSMLQKGDILINLVGASIGRTAIYTLPDEANINQAVSLVRLVDQTIGPSTDYLLMFLNSDAAVDLMLGSRVITAQPNISLANVNDFPIPLPPLAEQHRIVAKVDALMALCDRLEAALATTDTTGARLLEALLHEALDPAAAAVTEAAE